MISYSVIGSGSTVKSGAKVSNGSVLGPEVVIDINADIVALKLEAASENGMSNIFILQIKSFQCQDIVIEEI